jgi:hypothetical protein
VEVTCLGCMTFPHKVLQWRKDVGSTVAVCRWNVQSTHDTHSASMAVVVACLRKEVLKEIPAQNARNPLYKCLQDMRWCEKIQHPINISQLKTVLLVQPALLTL